jgi:hypothetical protein
LILGEIVNFSKVNLPKGQFANTHTQNAQNALVDAFSELTFWQVDFLEVGHFS